TEADDVVAEALPMRGVTLLLDGTLSELAADPVGGTRLSCRIMARTQRDQGADQSAQAAGVRARTAPGGALAEHGLHHHDHRRRPRTMPAEISTQGPWQMVATIFPAWWISRTRLSASASRRILSGAHPPGTTMPSSDDAGKSATRPSTLHGYPCFPRYSRSPRPASFTSKPASSRRSFGYQTSRSSYSGPTSIRIARTSFPSASSGCMRSTL